MDRIEMAKDYAVRFAELNRFQSLKKLNENYKGLGFLIGYLHMHRDTTVYAGDIARASCVSTARVAAALNKLEEQGVVMRATAGEDSRKTVVSLTDAGLAKAETVRDRMLAELADIIDSVGTEDMDEFLRIGQKINSAIEQIESKGEQHV